MEIKHLHVPGATRSWPAETHRTCSAEHHFPRHCSPADSCIAGTAWDVAIDSNLVNLDVLMTTGGRLAQSRVDWWSCAGSARGCVGGCLLCCMWHVRAGKISHFRHVQGQAGPELSRAVWSLSVRRRSPLVHAAVTVNAESFRA